MGVKRLPREERIQSIMDAALDIVCESGPSAVTALEIAARLRIAPQHVYHHFHSADEILNALYDRTSLEYVEPLRVTERDFGVAGILRLERILRLPPKVFTLLSSAFLAQPNTHPSNWALHERLDELIETNWIAPMVRAGIDRTVATSGIYALLATTMQFRNLILEGRMSQEGALAQLSRMINALFPTSHSVNK